MYQIHYIVMAIPEMKFRFIFHRTLNKQKSTNLSYEMNISISVGFAMHQHTL